MRRVAILLVLIWAPSAWSMEVPVTPGVSLELAQQRAVGISNVHYRLVFDIPEDPSVEIAGSVGIAFELRSLAQPVQLDFREDREKLRGLRCNGRETEIDFRNDHLVLPVSALKVGVNTVDIEFVAGSSSLNRKPDYLYTLFVPDRARTAFPVFDQPDLKATYDLTLDIPTAWTALANAPLESVTAGTEKSRYQFAKSDLISSYLFSFVAGQFETIERTVDGRKMTLLHRETDPARFERNVDAIFEQHGRALDWLEAYTGIDYPFKKFGFALIPSFQYSGMEHVGAILYRAESLLLEQEPTDAELLGRASLIAHETAHMWFGNLVTMAWFNDVWTKEVFANFMAAKIVNPLFPQIDHQLSFLVAHYPGAYAVDRTKGANAIRQDLPNLAEAGQMYGNIIYDKAPIMMRQLELIVGEEGLRSGLTEYLHTYAYGAATWPGLISILDKTTKTDLNAWSEVWVNTPGRPEFSVAAKDDVAVLKQQDPGDLGRVWPQRFALRSLGDDSSSPEMVDSTAASVPWPSESGDDLSTVLFNADGMGYGLFPAQFGHLARWANLSGVEKGSLLIDLHENMLEGRNLEPGPYLRALIKVVAVEKNQLLLGLVLAQMLEIYNTLLTVQQQAAILPQLEATLWQATNNATDGGSVRLFFETFSSIASSSDWLDVIYKIWAGEKNLDALSLSEEDLTRLAQILAIRLPDNSEKIIATQMARIESPDSRRRLAFLMPSLSADEATRDAFFRSLADESNRHTESWVLDALQNLHHPSRTKQSQKYLQRTLELLQEVQVTGDIFFPARWLTESFQNHNSADAVTVVDDFLAVNPTYNRQLRMKVLQAADKPMRAQRILAAAP